MHADSDATTAAATAPTARTAAPVGRAAVFDLDRTLLPGSSLLTLARAMSRRGLLSGPHLASGMAMDQAFRRRGADDAQVERLRARALRQVAGLDAAAMRSLVDEVGMSLARQVRPGARLLLRRHLEAGDFVVVLSASPQELVDAVASRIGAHRSVGTRAECVDGRYTGNIHDPFCYGPGKLTRLEQDLGPGALDEATAYADSASDLPVLHASREAVAVNPDRTLRRVAHQRRWPIIRFD